MIRYGMEGDIFVLQAESSADLLTAKNLPRTGVNARRFTHHEQDGSEHFWGASKTQITEALTNGWPEGTEKVSRIAGELRGQLEKPKSFKRRQRWMEDGDEPSWEREQAGRTEIWRTSRRDTMRGPTTVELLGAWGGLASVRPDELQWDGIVLTVLIDLLEEAGYRCGASMNNASSYGGWGVNGYKSLVQVTVKEPGMPLDIASLVPVVAFPGVYRWHGLSLKTLAPFDISAGFGSTMSLQSLPPVSAISKTAVKLNHAYNEAAAKQEVQRVLDLFKDTSAVSNYIP